MDTVFGLLHFAAALWIIYTRFQLASMEEGAPDKLTAAYVVTLLLNAGYLAVVSGTTKVPVGDLCDSSFISSMISGVVMILANRSYYGKRESLFGKRTEAVTAKPAVGGTAEVRYCTRCGAKAESGDQWCTRCGARLD